MHKVRNLAVVVVFGTMMAGVSGCSMFSPTNAPVDCNLVKTQQAAGKTDAQIATDLGAKESEVAACRGPEQGGNKTTGSQIPESY